VANSHCDKDENSFSRRSFLKTSAVAAGGVALVSPLSLAPAVHAAGSDILRIGLIGCGGRGTGAAEQAMNADPNVKLVALGDTFMDQVEVAARTLKESNSDKFAVTPANCFDGFDAYKRVLECGVDVVVLATPPHFRPQHLKAAVDAGKHCFVEKPVAVDAPGVRSVLATCEEARKKGLSIVSGLCYRYEPAKRETFKRVHDGAVGDIVALNTVYNTSFTRYVPRKTKMSDMEYQIRNWFYYTWLSGDHIVEQHVHSLDKVAWAMKDEYPVKAYGVGGRQSRTDPSFGHIFDHHSVVYEFKNGVKAYSQCRQQVGCYTEVTDQIIGNKGVCNVMKHEITGAHPWRYRGKKDEVDMYQSEHNDFFASIRSGKPINNGNYMSYSSLMAIMGRMATYTGQLITWDMALHSKEDMTPAKYEWSELAVAPVAKPGVTKFV
jgi:predicted dehydrogenase